VHTLDPCKIPLGTDGKRQHQTLLTRGSALQTSDLRGTSCVK
jgi:hypothetical protein